MCTCLNKISFSDHGNLTNIYFFCQILKLRSDFSITCPLFPGFLQLLLLEQLLPACTNILQSGQRGYIKACFFNLLVLLTLEHTSVKFCLYSIFHADLKKKMCACVCHWGRISSLKMSLSAVDINSRRVTMLVTSAIIRKISLGLEV